MTEADDRLRELAERLRQRAAHEADLGSQERHEEAWRIGVTKAYALYAVAEEIDRLLGLPPAPTSTTSG